MKKRSQFKHKSDIILELAKKKALNLKTAGLCVDNIQEELTQALLEERRIEIRGFGSFSVRRYKAYKGRNPQNQKKIHVRAKKRPHFKVGAFKEELNV